MNKLPRWFLIGWYIATVLYTAFLVVTFPHAIQTFARHKLSNPAIGLALQDLVAVMAAVYLPFMWVYGGGNHKWHRVYRVVGVVFFAILIVGFLALDIQYTF